MKRILIVDDEELIRYSVAAIMKDKDTEIVTQPNGSGALKALREWRFDLCFLDVQLPDASGLDLVKVIRQLAPKTKVVMMSGSTLDPQAVEIIKQYAFLFLTKPFDLSRIKKMLDGLTPADENTFHELQWLEGKVTERRRNKRKAAAKPVSYVTPAGREEDIHKADVLDISDTGTRIRTSERLEPGSMIRFKNSINNASGIVRWSSVDRQRDLFIAGIQFIGKK